MNFWDIVVDGEYVMFALASLFLIVVAIWWARAYKLSSLTKKTESIMHQIRDYVMEGDIENAMHVCQSANTPGSIIILAGLKRVGRQMPEIFAAMQTAREGEIPDLQKGLRWLRAIAVIAPLAGVGGTLGGICDKLCDLSELGTTVDVAQLAGAVAPTIVTTIAGIITGVISLFAYICLEGSIDKTESRLADFEMEFTDLLNEPS